MLGDLGVVNVHVLEELHDLEFTEWPCKPLLYLDHDLLFLWFLIDAFSFQNSVI